MDQLSLEQVQSFPPQLKAALLAALPQANERAAQQIQINQRIHLEQNFEAFVCAFWDEVPGAGTMSWNWHMSILCSELQLLAERVFKNQSRVHDLIFNVSPGTSKSTIGSILFPAWTWTRMPQARHICASHTETLVLDLAAKARYVIQSEKYQGFWPVQLRADQSTKSYYANTSGGDRLSCTVGGKSPTGFHAHFLTCLPGHVKISTSIGPVPIASLVENKSDLLIAGYDHSNNEIKYQQIIEWQRSPGRRLLRIKLCRCDDLANQPKISNRNIDISVRGWDGPESGHENICIYREVEYPLPTVSKNLDNQSTQEVGYSPSDCKISENEGQEVASKLPSTNGGSQGKNLEAVNWQEVYDQGMSREQWIAHGCLHWLCYSCRQLFTSIPIPPKFICSLCQDKDHTPTPSKRNSSDQEVEATVELFLECTEDHPVFILEGEQGEYDRYLQARDLLPGDLLLGSDGSPYRVKSIEVLPDIPEFVYNLQTEPNHNFFANGVLVHNCDDPIDPKRAVSEAELKTAADFVTNILPSRKVDKAVAVTTVIMQRLHYQDPTGILLEKAKLLGGIERIRHICLPARLADNVQPESLREKYTNGLMDPDRLPEIILREQEILLGAYAFAGQYLQSPTPLTGGIFQLRYFSNHVKAAPYNCVRIRYWDRAATQDGGCYTAGVLLARSPDGLWFVEHVVHGQWEPDRRNQEMKACAVRDRARYGPQYEPLIYIEAEGGSSGRDSYKGVARALAGFSVREHRPTGRKEVRAEPWACLILGTLVQTEQGPCKIEDVRKGDRVLTRRGYRKVLWSGKTKEVEQTVTLSFNNGTRLSGTEDHRILVASKGWIYFSEVQLGDEVVCLCASKQNASSLARDRLKWKSWWSSMSRSCSRVLSSVAAVVNAIFLPSVPRDGTRVGYTKQFGSTSTGRFRRDTKSIIKMATLITTPLTTSNVCRQRIMEESLFTEIWKRYSGTTVLQKQPSNVGETDIRLGQELLPESTRADAAVRNLNPETLAVVFTTVPSCVVPENAKEVNRAFVRCAGKKFGGRALETLSCVLKSAGNIFGRFRAPTVVSALFGVTRVSSIVHEFVHPILTTTPVYDLTVEGEHEFFANGILVHNCQLAAGNVYLVADGLWDLENYVQEHIHFPLGKWKDQVDSSTGAYTLLTQQRPAGGLRSYRLQHHRKKGLQVILCSPEQLTGLELTRRCLLVFLKDPEMVKEVMSVAEGVSGLHDGSPRPSQPPVCAEDKQLGKEVMSAHSLPAVLDSLTLDFLPNSPADFQESWEAVLPDYGTTAESLLLTRDKAKRFWAFVTRHRDPWAEAVVLVDDNEQRLLAAGLATCDGLGLPRSDTLAWTGRDSWQASRDTKAEAGFIYEQLRAGRNLVI